MNAVGDHDDELPLAIKRIRIARHRVKGASTAAPACESDLVAEEVAVALEYNGVSHAVMMASPLDLKDFVVGFSLTEGIIAAPDDIYDIETLVDPLGIRMRIELSSERFAGLKDRRRSLTGLTGCGICGAQNLAHALRQLDPLPADAFVLRAERLHAAFVQMRVCQPLQQATGATHAAGWVDATGTLRLVREDIGRHNALDKVLGAMARTGVPFRQGAAIVTSRASVELVQKAAMLGVPILATVSGPTALAIRMAENVGLTLAAYFRDTEHVRYAHGHRLGDDTASEGPDAVR